MTQFAKVSFKEAIQLIQHVILEAEKINKHVAVAVSGPEGEMISFLRMDEASPASSTIAQNKAYTSACDRKSTKEMGEMMITKSRPPAYWGDSKITGFGGGVPILQNSKVIGGIGVSGLSEAEDERIARAAIEKVYGGS
jgi:glc operon protein GlcG